MNIRNVTETFKKVAKQYQADMEVASRYIKFNGFDKKTRPAPIGTDARDFAPMVAMIGIEGETREQRDQDIRNKIDNLVKVFSDPDHSKRTPYLKMLYDLPEQFDIDTVKMDDPKEVGKLLQCYLLDQTFGEKRKENPEYFNQRYPTAQDVALLDARAQYRSTLFSFLVNNLKSINSEIKPGVTLPTGSFLPEAVLECCTQYAKLSLDQVQAEKEGAKPSRIYQIPVLDVMLPYAAKGVKNAPKFPEEDALMMFYHYSVVLDANMLATSSKKMEGLKEANMNNTTDGVFVDGMPYTEFLKTRLPRKEAGDQLNPRVLTSLLLSGRHRVDVVHSYRNEEGQMQYEAKCMRAAVTPEQEQQYMNHFTWFRRTFFNWGPFRIEPLREKLDRIADDPNMDERHAGICRMQEERVKARFEAQGKKYEPAKQKVVERSAYQKAKERLDAAVEKWEKESVVGILGQQVKGSCESIRTELEQAKEGERYTRIAENLARQVLYTALCDDRQKNNGAMGELERSLMGDGNPATIRANIESAAKKMAKDPVLKEVFLKKTGIEAANDVEKIVPGSTKFEEMIANGGFEGFTAEYMQTVKNNAMKNEQPANAAENQMENQRKAEMSIVK